MLLTDIVKAKEIHPFNIFYKEMKTEQKFSANLTRQSKSKEDAKILDCR